MIMLLALSKFLPRVFHKKSTGKPDKSVNDESATGENTRSCTCRVVLLDESELSLGVKVSISDVAFPEKYDSENFRKFSVEPEKCIYS